MGINVNMTVREALSLLNGGEVTNDLCERIVKALESKCEDAVEHLNITLKTLPSDRVIPVIKAIRGATGWGLKETKDFVDTVRNGSPNTFSHTKDVIEKLNNELVSIGCDTHVDSW